MTTYMDHKDLSNEIIDLRRAQEIADGVVRTQEKLAEICESVGRSHSEVTLMAATKTRDVAEIMAAIDAGIRCIGENRPQEVWAKVEGLRKNLAQRNLNIPLDLIGQLQSNKISKIIGQVDTIETIDSVALAQKISTRVQATGQGPNSKVGVFVQVNVSGEDSKSGCALDEAYDVALGVAHVTGLELRGLMTIGLNSDDEVSVRQGFAALREVRDRILASEDEQTSSCTELSMGMSSDMPWAVAEGATIVRVGTGIFGQRDFL